MHKFSEVRKIKAIPENKAARVLPSYISKFKKYIYTTNTNFPNRLY